MKNYHNIDKSGFHKGQYVGYNKGAWRIKRCNTSYGVWHAAYQENPLHNLYAFTLASMSKKLDSYDWNKNQYAINANRNSGFNS